MVSTTLGNNSLSNFTVYVQLSGTTFKSVANGGHLGASGNQGTVNGQTVPYDLIFATSSACSTNFGNWEIGSWDPVNGVIEAWIRVSSLSYSANTVFYACYGNTAIVGFQGGAVGTAWDSNYKGVYHFGTASTLSLADSTSNGNNLNHPGSSISAVAGIAGGALYHVTASDPVTVAAAVTGFPATLESWYYPTNYANNPVLLGLFTASTYSNNLYSQNSGSTAGQVTLTCNAGTTDLLAGPTWTSAANNAWHDVVAIGSSATNWSLIVDAVVYGPDTTSCSPSFDHLSIGITDWGGGNYQYPMGYDYADEVRLSNIARSYDWIITGYNNLHSLSTYVTVGSEGTPTGGTTSVTLTPIIL
jgi:hypothetical protein